MNIDYLRIFINLSETLNFSATAQAMNLSQPAISKAINRLEAELGFQLFIRSKRQVLLTESGQQFQKRIRIIVRNLDKAISEGRLIDKNYQDSVSIGITGTPCECKQLPIIINTYNNSQYSKIRFYLETFDHNQLKEHLVNHECDIIFSSNDDLPNGQDLVFNKLRTSHFVCVCQVQDPLTKKKVLSLEDLKSHNLIMIDEDWCSKEPIKLQRKISKHFNYQNITYVGSILVNFLMIKAGMGVSILPDFVYSPTDPDLTTVPFYYDRFLEYGIVYNYNSLSQPGKRFIKWLALYKEFFRSPE